MVKMQGITFSIHICGISDNMFSPKIMIYAPHDTIDIALSLEELSAYEVLRCRDLINYITSIEKIKNSLGGWGFDRLDFSSIYIEHKDYLVGISEDKLIFDVFEDFNSTHLYFHYFLVGGASISDEFQYFYRVYPNERTHINQPHIHVCKSGVEIRYSLDPIEPLDPLRHPHSRDNRKRIIPFIEKRIDWFWEQWNLYTKGYKGPAVGEDGKLYYPES
jgi:hypothetical protein